MATSTLIGAGGLFYSAATRRYLFILRDTNAYNGTWGLPGGKVEVGESVIEALTREVDEEIGDSFNVNKIIPIEQFTSDNTFFIYHTFLMSVDNEFIPELNHEHRGYCWVHLEDHPKPLHPGVWKTFNFDVIKEKLKTIEFIL